MSLQKVRIKSELGWKFRVENGLIDKVMDETLGLFSSKKFLNILSLSVILNIHKILSFLLPKTTFTLHFH